MPHVVCVVIPGKNQTLTFCVLTSSSPTVLLTAARFGVLAATTVTNGGTTNVLGDVGVDPGMSLHPSRRGQGTGCRSAHAVESPSLFF